MKRPVDEFKDASPHADKVRRYRIGQWVTEARLAKGWTMVDVAMRLHATFPDSRLGNQGRIAELETGNGVNRARWTPEVVEFLHSIFQPCPPVPEDPWGLSDEYVADQQRRAAQTEAKRMAELVRQ